MTATQSPAQSPVIHIVDDEPDVRDSLALLMRSVGYASRTYPGARDFLEANHGDAPGCLLVDVRMPGMSGLELQERLTRAGTPLPVIVMTGHGDVPMAVRAMKAGAFDFIEKPFNDQVLIDRIGEALSVARRACDAAEEGRVIRARYALLTQREREVMAAVVAGRLNKLIADDLALSVRTVEIHRAHIMEKMAAASLPELVRMSLRINSAP